MDPMPLWAALAACSAPPGPVSVTALEYGRSARYSSVSLVGDAPKDERRPASWQVWLIRTADHVVLVDTGFVDAARAEAWGIEGYVPVAELLPEALGLPASAVTDVVVTHGHWDHAGGVSAFPNARVWMQEAELAWMRSRVDDAHPERSGVRLADLRALEHHPYLHLVDGDVSVIPEVRLHREGGHTPGVTWVEVRTDPPVVLTSDIAYLAENLARDVAPGGSMDPEGDLAAYDSQRATGGRLVPGHDPDTVGDARQVELAP